MLNLVSVVACVRCGRWVDKASSKSVVRVNRSPPEYLHEHCFDITEKAEQDLMMYYLIGLQKRLA